MTLIFDSNKKSYITYNIMPYDITEEKLKSMLSDHSITIYNYDFLARPKDI